MPAGNSELGRQLLRLAGPPSGETPDADLLDRFVRERDAGAFGEILRRHSALVFGVCRRVVRQQQDAEDAFQATFLVLAQKAASVRRRISLAAWLHGVAYRCAARVRGANQRRRRHEGRASFAPAVAPPPDLTWDEVRQALDEELARLPEKYRAPLVLCYLRGMTQCEAAQQLGWGTGVLRGRLDRGRERLRARLTRRGLELSAGFPALTLAADASAGPSANLLQSTQKAALFLMTGRAAGEVVPASVAVLTKGVLQTMLWTKIRIVAASVLALTVLGAGAWWGHTAAGSPAGPPLAQADRSDHPGTTPPADKPKPEGKRFAFEMRDKPWSQVIEWYADNSGLAFVGNVKPTGTFTFIPSRAKRTFTLEEITDLLNEALLAQKYLLVRRTNTFTLLPADEKVDPSLIPRVKPEELDKRANTELVSVDIPLKALTAKDIAPETRKLLGAFGEVVVLEKANQLIVRDTAGNVRCIVQTIREVEARQKGKENRKGEQKN